MAKGRLTFARIVQNNLITSEKHLLLIVKTSQDLMNLIISLSKKKINTTKVISILKILKIKKIKIERYKARGFLRGNCIILTLDHFILR